MKLRRKIDYRDNAGWPMLTQFIGVDSWRNAGNVMRIMFARYYRSITDAAPLGRNADVADERRRCRGCAARLNQPLRNQRHYGYQISIKY